MADNAKRRAELEAELAALDDGDDDDEVEFEYQGKRMRGTFRRVAAFAKSVGVDLIPAPDDADVTSTAKVKSKNSGDDTVRRFSGRRIS